MISVTESSITSVGREIPLGASRLWTVALARPIAGTRQVRNDSCRVLSMTASIRVACGKRLRDAITNCVAAADSSIDWLSERLAYVDRPNAH